MGVFDFLKKSTQNDDDGQDQSQTYTPMQTQAPVQSDVQASYGSFFNNTKPASNVTYPLPSAGATLTPNYGAGVPVANDDDSDKDDTVADDNKQAIDKLDITNTNYVVEDKTSLPPVQVTDDPLLIKGDNIIKQESNDDLFFKPEAPTNTPAPTTTKVEEPSVDKLDLEDTKDLDFNTPLPDLTNQVSKQLETPLLPGAEPIEAHKAVDPQIDVTPKESEPEIKTTVAPTVSENTGNDTEVPNNKNYEDFNPPLDSLVINSGDGTQGNWNPNNAFLSASNEEVTEQPKEEEKAVVPEKQDEPFLNDLVINNNAEPKEDAVEVTTETSQPNTSTSKTETEDAVDWLKDLETKPLDIQPEAETTTKDLFPTPKPLTSSDDLPEWMKEFESMQFEAKDPEASKPEPVKDLTTTLPSQDESNKKSQKEKKETKSESKSEEKKNDTKPVETKTAIVESTEPQATSLQLKYFRDVALVGLNSDSSDTSYSGLVKSLTNALKSSAARLIIDSSQGYGKVVLDSLKDSQGLEINGAYLRPYFSAYSDEPNGEVVDVKNYTETLFSNFIERLRYLYTSAELFIVLDSKGLVNVADISFLLAMQKMYYGKHKPVILFGAGWQEKMDTIGNLLNDDEKDKVYIVKDVNELAGVLKKIEEGYSKNNYYSTKRVTDLRDIEDEKQFMI